MNTDIKRQRIINWEDPRIGAKQGSQMSGLDYLRAITAGEIAPPPIMYLTGIVFAEVSEGEVIMTMEPDESHYNPIGTVHGGIIATICDSAASCAVHTVLPLGMGYTTLELKTNYVRPVTIQTGMMRCVGTVIHSGRRVATSEARLMDMEGKLYAHAIATCMVFPISGG